MKALLAVAVLLGLAGVCSAEPADLRVGTIQLLEGYSHKAAQGRDSVVGAITRADGKLVIHYDIGKMAGTYMHAGRKEECIWYREQLIGGHTFRSGLVKNGDGRDLIMTVYGDMNARTSGKYPANFTAKVESDQDIADVLLMVLSYAAAPDAK